LKGRATTSLLRWSYGSASRACRIKGSNQCGGAGRSRPTFCRESPMQG